MGWFAWSSNKSERKDMMGTSLIPDVDGSRNANTNSGTYAKVEEDDPIETQGASQSPAWNGLVTQQIESRDPSSESAQAEESTVPPVHTYSTEPRSLFAPVTTSKRQTPEFLASRGDVVWARCVEDSDPTMKFYWPSLVISVESHDREAQNRFKVLLLKNDEGQRSIVASASNVLPFAVGIASRPPPTDLPPRNVSSRVIDAATIEARRMVASKRNNYFNFEEYLKENDATNTVTIETPAQAEPGKSALAQASRPVADIALEPKSEDEEENVIKPTDLSDDDDDEDVGVVSTTQAHGGRPIVVDDGSEGEDDEDDDVKSIPALKASQSESRNGREEVDYSDELCTKCEKDGELLICEGGCNRVWHPECLAKGDVPADDEDYICDECRTKNWKCWFCQRRTTPVDSALIACSEKGCGKRYHKDCVMNLPLTSDRGNEKTFKCPRHFCGECKQPVRKSNATRCMKCPVTYHTKCIPPGAVTLPSEAHFVCAKHVIPSKAVARRTRNWEHCVVCFKGGDLVCCDGCPDAYHLECLSLNMRKLMDKLPGNRWYCAECVSGDMPYEGQVVWAKQGGSRYWPAKIWFSDKLPACLKRGEHKPWDIPLMWFGEEPTTWSWLPNVVIGRINHSDYREDKKDLKFARALKQAQDEIALLENGPAQEPFPSRGKPSPYTRIQRNVYLTSRAREKEYVSVCDCTGAIDSRCVTDDCINRATCVECDPQTCPAKHRCQNQRFQNKQYSSMELFDTGERGWGLRVTEDVPEGAFLMEYCGEVIDREECDERIVKAREQGETDWYILSVTEDMFIDSRHKGNITRFINHNCNPNAEVQRWSVRNESKMGVFAKVDIPAGTEVTYCYNFTCMRSEDEVVSMKRCLCGSQNCSGYLGKRASPAPRSSASPPARSRSSPSLSPPAAAKKRRKPEPDSKAVKKPVAGPSTTAAPKAPVRKEPKTKRTKSEKEKSSSSAPPKPARKPQPKMAAEPETICFICDEDGDLMVCGEPGCLKAYHLECVGLEVKPKGKRWTCPRHFCASCAEPSTMFCVSCPNSYCRTHNNDNLMCNPSSRKIRCESCLQQLRANRGSSR